MDFNTLLKPDISNFDVKFAYQEVSKPGLDGIMITTGRKMAKEIKGFWLVNHLAKCTGSTADVQ